MIGDAIKVAAKVAALVGGVAVLIVIFDQVTLPSISTSLISDYLSIGYTIALHYIPNFAVMWNIGLILIDVELALLGARIATIAFKWILTINS